MAGGIHVHECFVTSNLHVIAHVQLLNHDLVWTVAHLLGHNVHLVLGSIWAFGLPVAQFSTFLAVGASNPLKKFIFPL